MCIQILTAIFQPWIWADDLTSLNLCLKDFPGGSDGKETACTVGDMGLIPGLGRSPGEGNIHSSILAWRIPWTEETGRLQSVGSEPLFNHK